MSTTSERIAIDPYFHWLNVTTPGRPPNAYELLGLSNFDSSLQRIQAAAKRKLAALDAVRDAADPAVWERVRGELELAIATLNDNTERAILDAELRRAGTTPVAAPAGSRSSAPPDGDEQGGALLCVECSASNAPDRKFCHSCGKSLWDQCPKCSAAHARSEKFCGQCGVNLRVYVAERETWCQQRLDSAEQSQRELLFVEAQALLREVARIDDAKLDRFAREAKSRMESYQAQRRELEAQAAASVAEARRLLAGHAVERALCQLEDVPERLRTDEHLQLLTETQARHKTILTLTGEIRELLAEKQTLALGPRLERLLALKPDHREALQLAEQLRGKLIESARKRLARHDHAGALELLRLVPSIVVDDTTRAVEQETREAIWRLERCQRATIAGRAQLLFVDQSLKSLAVHPETPALHKQWQTWARTQPREAWLAAPDTQALPRETPVGCPVDWVGRSLRLTGSTVEVDRRLREQPGRWFVALGLAIQGIGESAVDVNLAPSEKTSVWSRLSWGKKKSESSTAWGIDIGPSSIKGVLVKWDAKSQTVTVEDADLLEHEISLDSVKDEIQLADRLALTLKQFVEKHSLTGHKVCTNLSGISSISRWINLPPIADKKLDDALQFALRQQVAIPLDELSWDYASLEAAPEKKGELVPRRIAWIGAKQHVVQTRMQLWSRLDIKPDVLQSDAVALHNWLRFELAGPAAQGWQPEQDGSVTAILELGSDVTNLVFSGPRSLWFRAIGQAGDDVTRAIVREFQVSRSQAETWKREPHRVERGYQMWGLLSGYFEKQLDEWHRSVSQFTNLFPGEKPGRMICVGGGAAQWGLIDALRLASRT